MTRIKNVLFFGFCGLMCSLIYSCDELTVRGQGVENFVEIDSTRANFINVGGKLFSIPSPIQTAVLIKNSDIPYNREVLNNPAKSPEYISKTQRALNLGIYGTEMAYTSLYDDTQWSLKYFKTVEDLAEALEIKGALSPELTKRLGNNVGNTDSLLYLSGKFYEAADIYLKQNERYDIASLVLAGGWIEATYLTALAASNGDKDARFRLAAQKKSLKLLCDVLYTTTDQQFKDGIVMAQLDELKKEFEKITHTYTYKLPETDPDKKTTVIKSQTTYNLTDRELAEITSLIGKLRASIIQ